MATNDNAHIDDVFYKNADNFFLANAGIGLTYDDVSLATCFSDVLPRMTRLDTTISDKIALSLPIMSADMDTVTESTMAIAMALHGGIGMIHYNMSNADQVEKVRRVKTYIHGMIDRPATVSPDITVGDVLSMIERGEYNFSTFPVVDKEGKLLGLLRGGVVKSRHAAHKVSEVMTPKENVLTVQEKDLGSEPIATADKIFLDHIGTNKLLVVNSKGHLRGLFTLSDIERIRDEAGSDAIRPSRDENFRLRCGASVAVPRYLDGRVNYDALNEHVANIVAAGVDAVIISTAHGHSAGVGECVRFVRDHFADLTIIAGNVTSGEGVEYLASAGADSVKIGQGPGSICSTRIVAGVGIPQLTALYVSAQAAKKCGVRIIADGGITKSGDIVKALTQADCVMLGGMLAGCKEAPGKIMEINGKLYKEYRGMGSMEAMRHGSAARYGHDLRNSKITKVAPEGIEALKEVSGSVDSVLTTLAGGVQSGLGYLGASDLKTLRERARFIRVTMAGQKESAPHDVVEIKTTPNGARA